jgi:hypothetical protein
LAQRNTRYSRRNRSHTASSLHGLPQLVCADSNETWRAFSADAPRNALVTPAIDATSFDRDQPSHHYVNRTHYRVQALKVTVLVDVEMLYITDIHSRTSKKHDAKISPQVARVSTGDLRSLAADRGYDLKCRVERKTAAVSNV